MFTLEQFLQNTTWNPTLEDAGEAGKKILHMRLQVKPGTTANNLDIKLNGHDLRINFENKGECHYHLILISKQLDVHFSRTGIQTSDHLANSGIGQTQNRIEKRWFSSYYCSYQGLMGHHYYCYLVFQCLLIEFYFITSYSC